MYHNNSSGILNAWRNYQLKKYTKWELQVKFYLGQYEDFKLGDLKSASYEKQLSPWKILVFFLIWGDTRIGLIKLAPETI